MKKEKKQISLKEYFNISLWSLKVTWNISRFATIALLFSETIRNLRSLVNAYIFAKLIDDLISLAGKNNAEMRELIPLLIALLLINIFFTAVDELRNYANRVIRRTAQSYFEKMAYDKVNYLGAQTLELPDIANANQKMRDWISYIYEVGGSVVRIIAAMVKTIVTGVIILNTVPIVIPLVVVTAVIFYFQKRYFFKKDFDWQTNDKHLMERRKRFWMSSHLSDTRDIGEISITGAYSYLNKKFVDFFDYYNKGFINILNRETISSFFVSVLSNIALLAGYLKAIKLLIEGKISIGNTTFYMNAISNFYDGVEWLFEEIIYFRDYVMKIREVYNFFHLEPVVKDGEIEIPRFIEPPFIEIKNMSFHYPNNKENIFSNFSLKIESGEKLAIVGENGAGKTTLVKLLSRLYDPQEGEILINGINLKDIKINDWYKNLGVLFQDFNFYGELTVEENIYLGKSIKELDKEKIKEAAGNADADDFINKYREGYKTVMSERFRDGIRPSNGQRQKIAIARFFYRNAPVAIFDEPTSAIDAESEYRIFNRIYDFFKGKTVLIISHRFSTVRNADRIIVLKEGKLVEEGTHRELLAKEGVYASAYRKQAEGYKE